MATTPKTWPDAHGVKMDKAVRNMRFEDGRFKADQDFEFADVSGDAITDIGKRRSDIDEAWASVPTAVKSAMSTVQDYIEEKTLEANGIVE